MKTEKKNTNEFRNAKRLQLWRSLCLNFFYRPSEVEKFAFWHSTENKIWGTREVNLECVCGSATNVVLSVCAGASVENNIEASIICFVESFPSHTQPAEVPSLSPSYTDNIIINSFPILGCASCVMDVVRSCVQSGSSNRWQRHATTSFCRRASNENTLYGMYHVVPRNTIKNRFSCALFERPRNFLHSLRKMFLIRRWIKVSETC